MDLDLPTELHMLTDIHFTSLVKLFHMDLIGMDIQFQVNIMKGKKSSPTVP